MDTDILYNDVVILILDIILHTFLLDADKMFSLHLSVFLKFCKIPYVCSFAQLLLQQVKKRTVAGTEEGNISQPQPLNLFFDKEASYKIMKK